MVRHVDAHQEDIQLLSQPPCQVVPQSPKQSRCCGAHLVLACPAAVSKVVRNESSRVFQAVLLVIHVANEDAVGAQSLPTGPQRLLDLGVRPRNSISQTMNAPLAHQNSETRLAQRNIGLRGTDL